LDVEENERIAKKYNLLPVVKKRFSQDYVIMITKKIKGFRPRDGTKEKTPYDWYKTFRGIIPAFKEFNILITETIEEVLAQINNPRTETISGVIGAFRFLQIEYKQKVNFNGHKYMAMKTLLLYDIEEFELARRLLSQKSVMNCLVISVLDGNLLFFVLSSNYLFH